MKSLCIYRMMSLIFGSLLFKLLGYEEEREDWVSFFLFLKLWVEGKENVCMLWNKPALSRREMSLRSFRRFPSSPPELSWAKIGG